MLLLASRQARCQQASEIHSSPKPSPNPFAKHSYNKCLPPLEATQRPLNNLVTYVASPAWPSPDNVPQTATSSLKHQHSTQHTNSSHQHNTDTNMRGQHQSPSSHPPLQARLQVLDAIKPATRWTADERAITIAFTPMDVNYNPS